MKTLDDRAKYVVRESDPARISEKEARLQGREQWGPSGWTDRASRGVSEAEEGQIWQPFSQTNCDRDERKRVS
jgi:hypothetical protein